MNSLSACWRSCVGGVTCSWWSWKFSLHAKPLCTSPWCGIVGMPCYCSPHGLIWHNGSPISTNPRDGKEQVGKGRGLRFQTWSLLRKRSMGSVSLLFGWNKAVTAEILSVFPGAPFPGPLDRENWLFSETSFCCLHLLAFLGCQPLRFQAWDRWSQTKACGTRHSRVFWSQGPCSIFLPCMF